MIRFKEKTHYSLLWEELPNIQKWGALFFAVLDFFLEKWQVLSFRQLSSYISVLCFPFIHLLCNHLKSKALMPMKSSWCLWCLLVSHHWDYCNHRIMLRSVLILLQSPTSHLPLRVSVWSSLHRHIFLVALDTHLDTKPSVAIRGLLFPRYFCPFLFPLTKRLFCVVQDLVMRNAPPPIPARGGRKKELANCFALGWTGHTAETAWPYRGCGAPVYSALSLVQRLSTQHFS